MTNDAHILLDEARRVKIGNAFFKGYGLIFKYSTLEEQDQGIAKQEILYTISDLKYNDDDGGPLRAIVNLSVTEPDYCSKYWAKYVNTIVVV